MDRLEKRYTQKMVLSMFLLTLFQILFMIYRYQQILDEVGIYAMSISEPISHAINIEEYKKIVETKERTEYFYDMQEYFKKVQKNPNIKYVYVEHKISDNQIEYIFDAEKDSLGELDENYTPQAHLLGKSFYTQVEDSEKWGTVISGYSPLIDSQGKIIGAIGVDIEPAKSSYLVKSKMLISFIYNIILGCFFFYLMYTLLNKEKKKNRARNEFYRNTVNVLTKSLSKKSDYTCRHCERVSKYAETIAKELGYKSNEIETIKWAAILHDIGKIGISDNILDKPTKLTNEEFNEIKKHPIYSKEILDEIFFESKDIIDKNEFKTISDIACLHHERWDGKGYPNGISQEEIPLSARIITLADSLEAMLSERPYKKPLTLEQAIQEIKNHTGTQFDPKVVKAFLNCVDKKTIKD